MENKRDLCLSAHRGLRHLPYGEGPYRGCLVSDGSRVAVATDDEPAAVSAAWHLAGSEHIAAPRDIAMSEDGVHVLMPWCAEEIGTFLARRTSAAEAVSSGEITTLVISLLRGLDELSPAEVDTPGVWWLSDEQRPLLVLGAGESALSATRALLLRVGEATGDRACARLIDDLYSALERPRRALGDIERWEHEFLQLAAPKPLRAEVLSPAPVRHIDVPRLYETETEPDAAVWRGRLVAFAAAARQGRDALAQRIPRPAASVLSWRPRPIVLAAILGGIVIVAGALWPEGGESAAALKETSPPVIEVGNTDTHTESEDEATPVDEASEDVQREPISALAHVLAQISSCADACADLVVEATDATLAPLQERAGLEHELSLIDDYGDLAVVRVESTDAHGDLIVVLARVNELWLVRDVYDAADQPE